MHGFPGLCTRGNVEGLCSGPFQLRECICMQRATGERAAAFRRTVDLCQHRLTELKDYVDSIFQAVMAHRFRCLAATDATTGCVCGPCHASSKQQTLLHDCRYVRW